MDYRTYSVSKKPDFSVRYRGSEPILIECKNVLRQTLADGTIKVDFQKTRASKGDPCSRFYKASDFQVLAACLHPCTEKVGLQFPPHPRTRPAPEMSRTPLQPSPADRTMAPHPGSDFQPGRGMTAPTQLLTASEPHLP